MSRESFLPGVCNISFRCFLQSCLHASRNTGVDRGSCWCELGWVNHYPGVGPGGLASEYLCIKDIQSMFAEVRTSTLEELKLAVEHVNEAMYSLVAHAVASLGSL